MTLEQYAQLSDYTVVSGLVVLALAFLVHMAEWGFARTVVTAEELVGAGAPAGSAETVDERPSRLDVLSSVARSMTSLAALLLVIGIVCRGFAAERVPWGNMYEFGVVGAAIALVVYLVLVRLQGVEWAGGIVTGFALVLLGIALTTRVPAGPLVPALHSPWLVIHVAAVMTAGAFFLLGTAASVMFLLRSRAEARGTVGPFLSRFPVPAKMDQLAYRVIAVGFPLWTFGALIAGPIWAHYAWGRYWGWDPKEVWAFITWVAYAGYMHARVTAGWKGRRAAILAVIAFATFMFSYYGINLYGSGLHSYAK